MLKIVVRLDRGLHHPFIKNLQKIKLMYLNIKNAYFQLRPTLNITLFYVL